MTTPPGDPDPNIANRQEIESNLDKAFTKRIVDSKTEEELLQFLYVLETRPVHNDLIRHREIIRALTINHIRMSRFLKNLDDKNARLSRLVVILTIVAVIAGTVQAITGTIQIWLMLRH